MSTLQNYDHEKLSGIVNHQHPDHDWQQRRNSPFVIMWQS
jgi:hypothetical protein